MFHGVLVLNLYCLLYYFKFLIVKKLFAQSLKIVMEWKKYIFRYKQVITTYKQKTTHQNPYYYKDFEDYKPFFQQQPNIVINRYLFIR